MKHWMKQGCLAGVVSLSTLGLVATAHGQFQVGTAAAPTTTGGGTSIVQPAGRILNQAGPITPYNTGTLQVNPFFPPGYNPYFPYYGDFGGPLTGASNVINAQGQLMVSTQQAYIMREQARAERFANRRRALDEYLYEREKTPTAEDERQRLIQQNLSRSLNNTPLTEIWSGKALNNILDELRKFPVDASNATLRTFSVPLSDDDLKRVNLSSSKSNANVGLLKNGGKLQWPVSLDASEFKDQREHVGQLLGEAVKQAEFTGRVDSGFIRDLRKDLAEMQKTLKRNVDEMPISSYIEAKNYLNNLDAGVTALSQPDVGKYFQGKYDLRGKTMSELVKYMIDNGLNFAPAVGGEEQAYTALHQALATYCNAVAHPQSRQ